MSDPKVVDSMRRIRCVLTQEELVERARRMAAVVSEIEQITVEVDDRQERQRAGMRALNGIAVEVRDGAVDRDVDVRIIYDQDELRATVARVDTGEILEERAMTPLEVDELMGQIEVEARRFTARSVELPSCRSCGHAEEVHRGIGRARRCCYGTCECGLPAAKRARR